MARDIWENIKPKISVWDYSLLMTMLSKHVKSMATVKIARQENKLVKLYLKKYNYLPNGITNLSDKRLSIEEEHCLRRGLKFGILPKKINEFELKVMLEKKANFCSWKTGKKTNLNVRDDIKIATGIFLNSASSMCKSRKNVGFHRTLNNLSKDNTIKVCRLDKGNGVCLMNTPDYYAKLDSIVSDKSKFQKVEYDPFIESISNCQAAPWIKAEKSITYYLNTYMKSVVDKDIFKKLIPSGAVPGKLYGLAKVHKLNCPLRPVNCMIGTPEYKLAKFLDAKIKPHIPSDFTVNSTEQFIEKLRSYNCVEGDICVSFDVKSLFTNVPRSYTINKVCQFYDETYHGKFMDKVDQDGKAAAISSEILGKMLEKCTKSHFMYNKAVYTQIDGVQMGSPLGPTLANWFMGDIERNIFGNKKDFYPKLYTRYVDNVFAIFKSSEDATKFLEVLNSQHENLQFTVEWPKGTLPFLDVEINLSGVAIETWLYRKPTNTGVVLNYKSIAPRSWKTGLIKCLLQRAKVSCSSQSLLLKEVNGILD